MCEVDTETPRVFSDLLVERILRDLGGGLVSH